MRRGGVSAPAIRGRSTGRLCAGQRPWLSRAAPPWTARTGLPSYGNSRPVRVCGTYTVPRPARAPAAGRGHTVRSPPRAAWGCRFPSHRRIRPVRPALRAAPTRGRRSDPLPPVRRGTPMRGVPSPAGTGTHPAPSGRAGTVFFRSAVPVRLFCPRRVRAASARFPGGRLSLFFCFLLSFDTIPFRESDT